jgi:hypothetical protein
MRKLTATAVDSFHSAAGLTLHFERSAAGAAPSAFTVEAGRVRNIRFARR